MGRDRNLEWAKGQRAWGFFRWALFAAGVSLLLYLPYRYATRPPTIPGLYAFLLPLSAVLAAAGIALALKPTLAARLNTPMGAGMAAVAVLWFAAGMVCIPSLTLELLSAPKVARDGTEHPVLQPQANV